MKKLLMVVSTLDHGGAQKVFANLSRAFSKEWQVDILLNSAENITFPYAGNIISLGIDSKGDRTKLTYLLKVFFHRYCMLRKLKRENGYSACISALESANVVNVLTGNKYCKTILTVHSFTSEYMKRLGRIKQIILFMTVRLFYNWADKIVVVSESAREDLIHNFCVKRDKTLAIYNGFQIRDIVVQSREKLSQSEKGLFRASNFTLITVGRLEEEKAQWHLIRALQKVKKKVPNIKLIILGDGKLKAYLLRLIKEGDLENNVCLPGFIQNPYRIMAQCDCFVMTSLFEGFPGVLIEALACGLPCISSDFDSGAREILAPNTEISYKIQNGWKKEEYGILCPVFDGKKRSFEEKLTQEEECLADAIIMLEKDKKLRTSMHEMTLKRAWEMDMEKVLKKWMEIL